MARTLILMLMSRIPLGICYASDLLFWPENVAVSGTLNPHNHFYSKINKYMSGFYQMLYICITTVY